MRKFCVASLALALLGGAAVPVRSQESPTFVRYDHAAIGAPRTIVSADFNRDGFPDVALGGTSRRSVGILLHHGLEDGDEGQRFGPLIEVVVGGGPFDMVAADLNRDGWPDLAVANADSHAITILLNNRTSVPFNSSFDILVGQNPRGIAIGDFDRDSIPDIVVTKFMGTTAEIRYGKGDGTFPSGALVNVPESSQGVATGDFNRDGWTDWVVVSYSGYAVFNYMGASGLSHQQQVPLGANLNVVTTGDFDKNGWLDIAAASTSSSTVQIMFRTADQARFTTASYAVASSPRGIEAADLNNDGWLDIVVAGRNTSSVSVLTRASDGTYVDAQHAAGMGARDIALTDFDQNSTIDILTANEYANSTTLLQNGPFQGTAAYAFEKVPVPMQWDLRVYGVADFNENGIPDLAMREIIFLDGTTAAPHSLNRAPADGVTGDFNRDGHADVLFSAHTEFSSASHLLRTYFGDGRGNLNAGPITALPGSASLMRAVDMNRDGRLDLVMRVSSRIETWVGRGDGTFTPLGRVEIAPRWLEVADVNRDGLYDVVASTNSGVITLLGDGSGGLRQVAILGGSQWMGFGLGDMTSDGVLDLVVVEATRNQWGGVVATAVVTARGDGNGAFAEMSRTASTPPDWWRSAVTTLLLADLDHDGGLDVLTGNGLFMRGGWELQEPQRFAVIGSDRMHAVDMNGDGLLDIVGVGHDSLGDSPNIIMLNTRRTPAENRAPIGVTLPDRVTYPYAEYFYAEDEPEFSAGWWIEDPDLHALRHRWTILADGRVVSTSPYGYAPGPEMTTGTYPMNFTVDDYRGGVVSKDFTLEMTPYKEAIINPTGSSELHGTWQIVRDESANEGQRLYHPNINTPKIQSPLAEPRDYVDVGFLADPTLEYKLWVRLKADGDYWGNDSVYIQFSGSTDSAGNAMYRIGTTSALAINLEECSGCGISGWGWEDDGWGAVNVNGVRLRFPEGGRQRLRIQAREDGVSIDTIILSSEKYLTTRPGTAKNDTFTPWTTGPWMGTWWKWQQ